MRALMVIFALTLLLGAVCAQAANSQQSLMKTCNAQAADQKLSGDQRKLFMSVCLSGKSTASAAGNTQQQKMKACNAEAATKSLKGDERKAFMSSCLKGAT